MAPSKLSFRASLCCYFCPAELINLKRSLELCSWNHLYLYFFPLLFIKWIFDSFALPYRYLIFLNRFYYSYLLFRLLLYEFWIAFVFCSASFFISLVSQYNFSWNSYTIFRLKAIFEEMQYFFGKDYVLARWLALWLIGKRAGSWFIFLQVAWSSWKYS